MVFGQTAVKLVGFTVNKDHQQNLDGIRKERDVDVRIVQEDESDKKCLELFGK